MGRIASLATIVMCVVVASSGFAHAQGSGSGSGSGSSAGSSDEIEIEPDMPAKGSGSGSGSAGAVTPTPPPAPTPPPTAGAAATTPSSTGGDAAAPVKDPKVAKKWLTAAQTLVQKGDYFTRAKKPDDAKEQYTNAVTAYQKAIEAGDDVSVYLALALVEDKLGQLANAYQHCKLVVDPKANAKPDVVKKAQAELDQLTTKVGVIKLTIKPEGTLVTMGGNPVGEAPLLAPLVLDPGTYTLSFAAVGYQPKDVELKVDAGAEQEKNVALDPVPVVVKQVDTDQPGSEQPTTTARSGPLLWPAIAGAGATGALLIAMTATGIEAIDQHKLFVSPKTSAANRVGIQQDGRDYARWSDACLVGSVLTAGFTAYWYVYQYLPKKNVSAKEHAKLDVTPWVERNAGGLVTTGRL
jgi:hypothetical protein